jgi:aryl-alcohol dehydrogenase-like predicted oxidoreductase
MGLPRAWSLVVDSPEDLLGPDGRTLWARLERLKDEGFFQRLGVRAGPEDEPALLARRFRPDLMQISAGLLDQRLVADGAIEAIADLGVEVHLRSPFTHGVLFTPREALAAPLQAVGPRLSRIRRLLAEAGADPLQAALAFARSRPGVSSVIVGVASPAELRAVLAAASAPPPKLDWSALSLDDALAETPGLAALGRLSSAA